MASRQEEGPDGIVSRMEGGQQEDESADNTVFFKGDYTQVNMELDDTVPGMCGVDSTREVEENPEGARSKTGYMVPGVGYGMTPSRGFPLTSTVLEGRSPGVTMPMDQELQSQQLQISVFSSQMKAQALQNKTMYEDLRREVYSGQEDLRREVHLSKGEIQKQIEKLNTTHQEAQQEFKGFLSEIVQRLPAAQDDSRVTPENLEKEQMMSSRNMGTANLEPEQKSRVSSQAYGEVCSGIYTKKPSLQRQDGYSGKELASHLGRAWAPDAKMGGNRWPLSGKDGQSAPELQERLLQPTPLLREERHRSSEPTPQGQLSKSTDFYGASELGNSNLQRSKGPSQPHSAESYLGRLDGKKKDGLTGYAPGLDEGESEGRRPTGVQENSQPSRLVQEESNSMLMAKMVDMCSKLIESNKSPTTRTRIKPTQTFDGSTPWKDYRAYFATCVENNGWSPQEKRQYLATNLRGDAQQLVLELDEGYSYEDLLLALEKRFGPGGKADVYEAELCSRTRRPKESLQSLGQSIRRLTSLAYPEMSRNAQDRLARRSFEQAIPDDDLRQAIHRKDPDSLDKAIEVALKEESYQESERIRRGLKPKRDHKVLQVEEGNDVSVKLQQMQKKMEEISKRVAEITNSGSSSKRLPTCKKCGEEGHIVRRCPTLTCYNCNKPGHLSYDCPLPEKPRREKNSPRTDNTNSMSPVRFMADRDEEVTGENSEELVRKIMAEVYICGTKMEFLVDSGAVSTMLGRDCYNRIPRRRRPSLRPSTRLFTQADGSHLAIYGMLTCDIELDGKNTPMNIVVADIAQDGILGSEYLSASRAIIDYADLKMHFQNPEEDNEVGKTDEESIQCTANSTSLRPTREEVGEKGTRKTTFDRNVDEDDTDPGEEFYKESGIEESSQEDEGNTSALEKEQIEEDQCYEKLTNSSGQGEGIPVDELCLSKNKAFRFKDNHLESELSRSNQDPERGVGVTQGAELESKNTLYQESRIYKSSQSEEYVKEKFTPVDQIPRSREQCNTFRNSSVRSKASGSKESRSSPTSELTPDCKSPDGDPVQGSKVTTHKRLRKRERLQQHGVSGPSGSKLAKFDTTMPNSQRRAKELQKMDGLLKSKVSWALGLPPIEEEKTTPAEQLLGEGTKAPKSNKDIHLQRGDSPRSGSAEPCERGESSEQYSSASHKKEELSQEWLCHIAEDVVISPYCGKLVDIEVDCSGSTDEVLIDNNFNFKRSSQAFELATTLTTINDGSSFAEIWNLSALPLELTKGSIVGVATPCTGKVYCISQEEENLHNISWVREENQDLSPTMTEGDTSKTSPVADFKVRQDEQDYSGRCKEQIGEEQCSHEEYSPQETFPEYLEDLLLRSTQGLSNQQGTAVRRLLLQNADIFASSDADLGRTEWTEHRIPTGDAKPIKQSYRRLPPGRQLEVDKQVKDLLQRGIIENSQSPWSAPIVLVQKKGGKWRFCVDYRRLNQVTEKDAFPIPNIAETLDLMGNSEFYSTLDLCSGYWQVPVDPKDREKTAFSVRGGQYQWVVMPFGLTGAPSTFCRLMERVLRGLTLKTSLVYLDDVISFGSSFEMAVERLQEIFERLREAGLRLKPSKCTLFRKEVEFLGHVVSREGVTPNPEKVKQIAEYPAPKSVKQVRQFIGGVSYYRRHIKDFAMIAGPLHELTKKNVIFHWNEHCEEAFKTLKEKLMSAPVMGYPKEGCKYILDTDASLEAIGAVLSQIQEGEEKVLFYASKRLNRHERNYCVTRRELLAVVNYTRYFKQFLYGVMFLLRTDHSSLRWLVNFKEPEGQLARWIQSLQEFQFETEYRPGPKHQNADLMSRVPCKQCDHCEGRCVEEQIEEQSEDDILTVSLEQEWTLEDIGVAQREDRDLTQIINSLEENKEKPSWEDISSKSPTVKKLWIQWSRLQLQSGVLCRVWEEEDGSITRLQVVTPGVLKPRVLDLGHSSPTAGHHGVKRTLERCRRAFYWPNLSADVRSYCRTCEICESRKNPPRRKKAPLQQLRVGAPMERWGIDVLGPFPETPRGNKLLLVCSDYFSKWPEVFPLPDQTAVTVANKLVGEICSRWGVPKELHSDQGRNFESEVFQEVCQLMGIDKTRTTPFHPQSNGLVERFNHTLVDNITKLLAPTYCQDDWDLKVPLALMAYRSSVHKATGETPSMMMMGREMKASLERMIAVPETSELATDHALVLRRCLEEVHEKARDVLELAVSRQRLDYNRKVDEELYPVGSAVWLMNKTRRKGRSPKLQPRWVGPFQVVSQLSPVTYRIREKGTGKPRIVHFNLLKPFHCALPKKWPRVDEIVRDKPVLSSDPLRDLTMPEDDKRCGEEHKPDKDTNFDAKDELPNQEELESPPPMEAPEGPNDHLKEEPEEKCSDPTWLNEEKPIKHGEELKDGFRDKLQDQAPPCLKKVPVRKLVKTEKAGGKRERCPKIEPLQNESKGGVLPKRQKKQPSRYNDFVLFAVDEMARSRSRSRRRREQSRDRKAHHKHAEEKKSEHVSRKDEPTRRRVVIEKPPSRDRSPKRQEREKPPNRDRSPKRQERKLGVHPFGKMIAATKNYVKSEIKAVASSKGDSKKKRLDTHKSPDSHVKRSDQTLSSSHHKTGTSGSTGFSTKSTSGTDHRDGLDSSHNFQERMTSAVNLISSISCPTAESAKVGPETDTSHVCSLCAQVFTRKFNLQRHMRHLHGIDTTSLGEEPKVPFFPLTPNLEEEVDDSPVEQDHETPTSEADGESGDGKASTREHKDGLAEDHYSSDTDQDGRQEREVEGESPPITLDIPEENKSEPKGKETSTKSQASVPSATARSPEVRTIGTQTHGPSFAPNVYVHVDQVYF